MPFDTEPGTVTIILFRLQSKSILQKEIYGDLKKSLKPHENGVKSE
jgi:hypothetical protein